MLSALPVKYTHQYDDLDLNEGTLTLVLNTSEINLNSFTPDEPEIPVPIDLNSPTLPDARVTNALNSVQTTAQDWKDLQILKLSKQLELANEAKEKQKEVQQKHFSQYKEKFNVHSNFYKSKFEKNGKKTSRFKTCSQK